MDNATGKAMDVFSAQTATLAGNTIRIDLSEEQEDLENSPGAQKRITIQTCIVRKTDLPSGVTISNGSILTIGGVKKEVQSFHQDEIAYSLALVVPRQGK